ncbi:MAG TPA: serine hydrolase domain-containing protein [Longimicrobium sp.]|nr:serine hydrolase domain-containing protein [Longimicrobium sp.]
MRSRFLPRSPFAIVPALAALLSLAAACTSARRAPAAGPTTAASPRCAGVTVAEVPAERYERAREMADEFARAFRLPGAAFAVGAEGRIVWSHGVGWADVRARRPACPGTRFRIGSVSKPLTAAGLMRLVQAGRLDLDAPVRRYVPSWAAGEGDGPTLRQLAGHLGGIRHYRGDEEMSARRWGSVRESLALFDADPPVAPPGERFHYSTYGYTLLSAAMEAAAGMEFTRWMRDSVFQPLGMTRTVPDSAGGRVPDRAAFYEATASGGIVPARPVDSSYKWAGGGYLSTVEDLARFGLAHLRTGFLSAESLEQLFRSQRTVDGRPTGYGIGWYVPPEGRPAVAMHQGALLGGGAMLYIDRERGVVVAIAMNVKPDAPVPDTNPPPPPAFAQLFAHTGP